MTDKQKPKTLEEVRAPYEATDYVAYDGKAKVTVRVHRLNPDMDALLERHGAAEGIFITAWNPRSQVLSRPENDAANARLREVLEDEDLHVLAHEGKAREGDWVEPGFLVLDLPPLDALALAEMFGQNAVVWQALGQPAHVLFSRVALP